MRNFISIVGLLLLICIGQAAAQTISPIPENWYCDARWQADLIFTGTVKEIAPFKGIDSDKPIPADLEFNFRQTITFEVGKIYKGSDKEKKLLEIAVHTISRNGKNPLSFKIGKKYLVYVERKSIIPISKSWITADVISPDGFTAPIADAAETAAFLEKVYQIDFDSLRDVLGYKGDQKVIKSGLISGKATSLPKPAYPEEARKTKAVGAVKILVLIDETGKVVLAKAVCPLNKSLAEAAEKAALHSRFSPVTLSGKAVKVSGVIIYNFTQ